MENANGVITELTRYRQDLAAEEASLQAELERVRHLISAADAMLQDYPRRRRHVQSRPAGGGCAPTAASTVTVNDIAHCNTARWTPYGRSRGSMGGTCGQGKQRGSS